MAVVLELMHELGLLQRFLERPYQEVVGFSRRVPARLIGLGFRPEHVHTPEQFSTSSR